MVLRTLQEQSEADALHMFVSCDLALLYPPAVLGVAGVLYAGKKQAALLASVGIENLEEIVKEIIVKGRLSLTGEVKQEEKRDEENKTPTGSGKKRRKEDGERIRVNESGRNLAEEAEDKGKERENKRIKTDPSSHSFQGAPGGRGERRWFSKRGEEEKRRQRG
ncbi:cyclin h [Cystoisospora suis]|uniref:Cyclin h n=1 Tax=Cystoisospora suis TaxID=483139 RepID=A0A2C6L6M1_9APIC|nr:cyclin h [Cystoisospora suis]